MDRFYFRVYEKDLEKIKQRAKSIGLSTIEFLRQAGLYGVIVQYNTAELHRLVWEVNKIGVNIN